MKMYRRAESFLKSVGTKHFPTSTRPCLDICIDVSLVPSLNNCSQNLTRPKHDFSKGSVSDPVAANMALRVVTSEEGACCVGRPVLLLIPRDEVELCLPQHASVRTAELVQAPWREPCEEQLS